MKQLVCILTIWFSSTALASSAQFNIPGANSADYDEHTGRLFVADGKGVVAIDTKTEKIIGHVPLCEGSTHVFTRKGRLYCVAPTQSDLSLQIVATINLNPLAKFRIPKMEPLKAIYSLNNDILLFLQSTNSNQRLSATLFNRANQTVLGSVDSIISGMSYAAVPGLGGVAIRHSTLSSEALPTEVWVPGAYPGEISVVSIANPEEPVVKAVYNSTDWLHSIKRIGPSLAVVAGQFEGVNLVEIVNNEVIVKSRLIDDVNAHLFLEDRVLYVVSKNTVTKVELSTLKKTIQSLEPVDNASASIPIQKDNENRLILLDHNAGVRLIELAE